MFSLSESESVISISPERVTVDLDFSTVKVDSFSAEQLAKSSAKQVAEGEIGKELGTSGATKFLGRGLFSKIGVLLRTRDGFRTIASIMTKSTGVPSVVRNSWADYGQHTKSNFFLSDEKKEGDLRRGLIQQKDFAGLALKEDQVKDAINSSLLHRLGVKVRLPLAGWEIDKLDVFDSEENIYVSRDIEWFKSQGYKGNELYQSAWGMSCPLRLEDINSVIQESINGKDINTDKLRNIFLSLIYLSGGDSSDTYQKLNEKWKSKIPSLELMEDKSEGLLIELSNLLEDFGIALCCTMGRNYEILYKNRLKHGNLHDQNISFFGELCDNSTVQEGLLEIGLAPENSADISGFIFAMRKYSSLIMILRGRDPFVEGSAHQSYLDDMFLSEIKKNWTSYDEYYEALIANAIEVEIGDNKEEIIREIEMFFGESSTSEIKESARKRVLEYLPIPL